MAERDSLIEEVERKKRLRDEDLGDRICARVAPTVGSTILFGLSAASAGEMWNAESWPERVFYGVGFVYNAVVATGIAAYGIREAVADWDENAEIDALERRVAVLPDDAQPA